MSGGVDSSVAAALLKQQGYEVIGMMLRLWSEPGKENSNRCCTPDAMAHARRVAARLDIPFYVIDAKDIFFKTIIPYFIEGYGSGQTPNPCLECNRHIRWEFLFNHALAFGADLMSTGHHVRKQELVDGRQLLLKGVDPAKDQSYVLHVMTQDKLVKAIFPIGNYPKSDIREMAESIGLSVAKRPDSQDLCFLAGEDYREFLKRNAQGILIPGYIVNREGLVLGQHSGLPNYTIGQRKGLGLTSTEPLYVLDKNSESNILVVGTIDELGLNELIATSVNWTCGIVPDKPFQAMVKTRYTAIPAQATVTPDKAANSVKVSFESPQRDITRGQAAVFYDGDIVIGGGLITNTK